MRIGCFGLGVVIALIGLIFGIYPLMIAGLILAMLGLVIC